MKLKKKVESQCIRDEKGRLLRDKEHIRKRWVPFFCSLLSPKSGMRDPDITKRLPLQPVTSAVGAEGMKYKFTNDEGDGKRDSS